MNPKELYELIAVGWRQLSLAITAGAFVVLGATVAALAVREFTNVRRLSL